MAFNQTVDNITAILKNKVSFATRDKINVIISSYLTAINAGYPLYDRYNSSKWQSTRNFIVSKTGLTKDPSQVLDNTLLELHKLLWLGDMRLGGIPASEKSTFEKAAPYNKGTATAVPDAIIEADPVTKKKTSTSNNQATSSYNDGINESKNNYSDSTTEVSIMDSINWTYVGIGAVALVAGIMFLKKGKK